MLPIRLSLAKEGVRLRKLSSVFQSRVTMRYEAGLGLGLGLVPWRRCPELERDLRSGAALRLFFHARHPYLIVRSSTVRRALVRNH
jgi:hypothetical protein